MNIIEQMYYQADLLEKQAKTALAGITSRDEYDKDNSSATISALEKLVNQAILLRAYDKFMKMEKADITALSSMSNTGKILTGHTLKSYETATSISKKYGMSIDEVLNLNNMTSDEFTAGKEIKVYTTIDKITVNQNVETYGSQKGKNILGTDLPCELTISGEDENADLTVLGNDDTFVQGMSVLTRAIMGDYPLENFGITNYVGSDMPSGLVANMIRIELSQLLATDERIGSIDSIDIETSDGAIKPTIQLTAVK